MKNIVFALLVPVTLLAQKGNDAREIQRDIAQLAGEVRDMRAQVDKMATAASDNTRNNAQALANIDQVVANHLRDQESRMSGPLASMGAQVNQMSGDYGALREQVGELSNQMRKLQSQMKDMADAVQMLLASQRGVNLNPPVSSNPQPANPNSGPGFGGYLPPVNPVPGSVSRDPIYQTPAPRSPVYTGVNPNGTYPGTSPAPVGVTADRLYSDALAAKQGGQSDFALQQFQNYLRWYGNTDLAAAAQFHVGDIYYNNNRLDDALKTFDRVATEYPEGPKTPDAIYMRGMCYLKQGQRDKAAAEFRIVSRRFPRSPAGKLAVDQLTNLGFKPAVPAAKKRPIAR